jgi:hypothetical protein
MEWFKEKFKDATGRLVPRSNRDFPRFINVAKGLALLNLWHRETQDKTDHEGTVCTELFCSREDLEQAFELYAPIAEANRMGLPPLTWNFWKKKLIPLLMDNTSIGYADVRTEYHNMTGSHLGKQALTDMVQILQNLDLINTIEDKEDRRKRRIIRRGSEPVHESGQEVL